MNNAVYGKAMGNLKKRIKIRVTKNSQDFIKYTSRPTCVNWKAFKNNLAATLRSQKLTLDYYLLTLTDSLCDELHEKNHTKNVQVQRTI